jgi:iron complex transport system substrate-binding protein
MAARSQRIATLALACALTLMLALGVFSALAAVLSAQTPERPARIVSLVPALTEMLFDFGAGPQVVAVSRYDTFPSEVRALPKAGGLLDPDTEAILRLAPNLVITYGSQTDLERRLTTAGIRVFSYRHGGVADTLQTIRDLGTATGHDAEGRASADRLQASLDAIRARVRNLPRPRTLLVFGREPDSLRQIYASAGLGFEHDVLEIAGGRSVFADARRESVQPSLEMLLAAAPEVIVELHANAEPEAARIKSDHEVWTRLASAPAVRNGRVHVLYGDYLAIPGPRLGQMASALARAIHPEAFR